VRGEGTLEDLMRERIRATIEAIIEEEAALGASRSQRVGAIRTGYRHRKRERRLATSLGADYHRTAPGKTRRRGRSAREWRSRMIPRYQ